MSMNKKCNEIVFICFLWRFHWRFIVQVLQNILHALFRHAGLERQKKKKKKGVNDRIFISLINCRLNQTHTLKKKNTHINTPLVIQ